MLSPYYISTYLPKEDPLDSKYFYFTSNNAGTILYFFIRNEIKSTLQFQSVDISDPTNIILLQDIELDLTTKEMILLQESYYIFSGVVLSPDEKTAFIIGKVKVRIVDITDPKNMVATGVIMNEGQYFVTALSQRRGVQDYLILLSKTAVEVMDINNVASINKVSSLAIQETGEYMHLSDDGNTLFVAGGWEGIFFVDLTDIASINMKRVIDPSFKILRFKFMVDPTKILLFSDYSIAVLDISDPENPAIKGQSKVDLIEKLNQLEGTDEFIVQLKKTETSQRLVFKMSLYLKELIYIQSEKDT